MQVKEIIAIFVTFIGVFSFAAIITILFDSFVKSNIREIRTGKRDIELIDGVLYEQREKVKQRRKRNRIIKRVAIGVSFAIVVPIFVISLVTKISGNALFVSERGLMVVASGSMSEKHKNNTYLVENNLNNQFQTYDIIVIEKVDNVEDLKLYDVIAFKNSKGVNIIHRIVDIKTINGEVVFTTQGDAVGKDDGFNPKFDQVIGRYTNKKMDAVGIFIIFLQSPSGIITILSVFYCLIMMDRLSNQIFKEEADRLTKLEGALKYKSYNEHNLQIEYKETIYYQGYAYEFDEHGFKSKRELEDENSYPKMKKVITDQNENEVSSKEIDLGPVEMEE